MHSFRGKSPGVDNGDKGETLPSFWAHCGFIVRLPGGKKGGGPVEGKNMAYIRRPRAKENVAISSLLQGDSLKHHRHVRKKGSSSAE